MRANSSIVVEPIPVQALHVALTSSAAQVSAKANVLATLCRSQDFKEALDSGELFHGRGAAERKSVLF
jgi:hypothetical protein